MELLERIKEKCIENKLSIRTLEEKSGIPHGTIGKWNTQEPGYKKIQSVAKTLNVSLEWLITGKESEELTEEENTLIKNYRAASPEGKGSIQALAAYQASASGVSTSKAGRTGTDN